MTSTCQTPGFARIGGKLVEKSAWETEKEAVRQGRSRNDCAGHRRYNLHSLGCSRNLYSSSLEKNEPPALNHTHHVKSSHCGASPRQPLELTTGALLCGPTGARNFQAQRAVISGRMFYGLLPSWRTAGSPATQTTCFLRLCGDPIPRPATQFSFFEVL